MNIGYLNGKAPRVLSLFSGCGGMDLGAEWAGGRVVWANDNFDKACKTHKNYFPHTKMVEGSIEDFDLGEILPDKNEIDVVLGGFPCQDFSVIWKRPGLEGHRGNLYTYFADVVRRMEPMAFVAENVKGLMSANNGKAIETIQQDFEKCGYHISTHVYNFAEYGVPQLRERVLIIGLHKSLGLTFVPPKPTHAPPEVAKEKGLRPYLTAKEALEGAEDVQFNNRKQNLQSKTIEMLKRIPPGGNFQDIPKESPYYVNGMISHVYRRLHPDKPSTTIIAGGGGGTWGYHYEEPRSLTNRERARLFGFPDDMEFFGTMSEVRRQIGNAVPPTGFKPIIQEVFNIIRGKPSYQHEATGEQKEIFNENVN